MNKDRVSGAEARQGRLGRPVAWVLGISLLLVIVVVAGLLLWGQIGPKQEANAPDRPVVGSGSGETAK